MVTLFCSLYSVVLACKLLLLCCNCFKIELCTVRFVVVYVLVYDAHVLVCMCVEGCVDVCVWGGGCGE